ncbi:methyl-accepting chemotaxis protein [Alteromonadaceae bacterium BrNp21-10]|nr:methyl-accepting chemotaxis protein [Alteromonadaceae bacterium BrNp21-10]
MQSIMKKVLLALIGSTSVILLLSFTISYLMQSNNEHNSWDAEKKVFSEQIQVILQEPVFAYDQPLVEGIINALVKNESITEISVMDQRKKSIAQAKSSHLETQQKLTLPLVWSDGSEIGSVIVGFSQAAVNDRLNAALMEKLIQLLLVLAVLSGILVLILRHWIIVPLQNLSHVLGDIAQGGGDLTQRIPILTDDEIGGLAKNFNDFIETVQSIVRALANANEELIAVSTRVDKISDTTNQDSQDQNVQTKIALEHLTQLQTATDEIAQNAEQTAVNTRNVQEVSLSSNKLMQNNLQLVQSLVGELDITAEVVTELRSQTQEINSVLEVIKGIADQTNLLALNAAIEAARAGESGRGFSVVADEVRALASKTHDSTIEIESIITSLQQRAHASFDATHRSKDIANDTIKSTQSASDALDDIRHKIDEINSMNMQIASGSEEQSLVTKEVSAGMKLIDSGADRLAKEAEMLHNATVELTQVQAKLVDQIHRFNY